MNNSKLQGNHLNLLITKFKTKYLVTKKIHSNIFVLNKIHFKFQGLLSHEKNLFCDFFDSMSINFTDDSCMYLLYLFMINRYLEC